MKDFPSIWNPNSFFVQKLNLSHKNIKGKVCEDESSALLNNRKKWNVNLVSTVSLFIYHVVGENLHNCHLKTLNDVEHRWMHENKRTLNESKSSDKSSQTTADISSRDRLIMCLWSNSWYINLAIRLNDSFIDLVCGRDGERNVSTMLIEKEVQVVLYRNKSQTSKSS